MRTLTSHKVNGCHDELTIKVTDEPGSGGACHRYVIDGPTRTIGGESAPAFRCDVRFQNGPIAEAGVNGITQEALLAIVEDRLLGFQSGEYSCRENAIALTKIQEAMLWLKKRTSDRIARGVEGTREK